MTATRSSWFELIKALVKCAYYLILMPFVLIGTVITAPYWYPKNKRKRCQKRLELMTLLSGGKIALAPDSVAELSDADFEMLVLTTMEVWQSEQSWVYLRIDWAATDEVAAQTAALAKQLGIASTFDCQGLTEEPESIETVLNQYGQWLKGHGFSLLYLDQGSDEYVAFACDSDQCDRVLQLAGELNITLSAV